MKPFLIFCLLAWLTAAAGAQIMISGNENKIDLRSGSPQVIRHAPPDTLTLLDFSVFPPNVTTLEDVSNSVIGPPSNIAISPNGLVALIADSLAVPSPSATNWVPASRVHILDLSGAEPKMVGHAATGKQPSGLSFHPSGGLALVANRAEGTVTVLRVNGTAAERIQTVEVCKPEESVSDVAIHPDGATALVSVQKGGYLALLRIDGEVVSLLPRRISVYGQPYRVVITRDGALGLTAGQGFGSGVDDDALSVIAMSGAQVRTIDHVALGASPESIEVSPNSQLAAAVVMNGSNLADDDPNRTENGLLILLERDGYTFRRVQQMPVGRIPEGVAFTADGKYLVVQCHPDRQLWVFEVRRKRMRDTGVRIDVPGYPSALRASM